MQSGFRLAHSKQDNIFTLYQIMEKDLIKNNDTFLGFLDIDKDFHKLNRDKIWDNLKQKTVNQRHIA